MADNFSDMSKETNKAINKNKDFQTKANDNFSHMQNPVNPKADKWTKDKAKEDSKGIKEANEKLQKAEAKKKKKSNSGKSKVNGEDQTSSAVGAGIYFMGRMSADIIRQILYMFVLGKTSVGSNSYTTDKKGNISSSNSSADKSTSIIDLMYNYNTGSSQKGINDILKIDIPAPEDQAAYLKKQMNNGASKIFNPDEGMEQDPVKFMQYSGSLASMIRDLSNAPFNEIYWTHEDNGKATLHYRQTPFEEDDWKNLASVHVDDSDVLSWDLDSNDSEQYSIFDIESDKVLNNVNLLANLLPITDDQNELIARYGYKYMEVSSPYFYTDVLGTGISSSDIEKMQQQQEEASTDTSAGEHYPSFDAFRMYFTVDNKKYQKDPQSIADADYPISPSYGGDELYEIVRDDLGDGKSAHYIYQDMQDYKKTHPEMTQTISKNKLTGLITIANSGRKGQLSKYDYVNQLLPPQEQVFISSSTLTTTGSLYYILSKGVSVIGKNVTNEKKAAQDIVRLSHGYIGSLQAYKLIQAYVKGKGNITSGQYDNVLKTVKHSSYESGVKTSSTSQSSADFYARYNKYQIKMFNYFADNAKFYSGSFTITGRLGVEYGKKLYVTDERRGTLWEFYIESVQHNFDFNSGWTTTIGVTRGLQVSQENDEKRWNMYWGHGQAFTGGFFGELSMIDIINQAKIREENEENSGSSSDDSTGTGSSAGGKWGRPISTSPSGGQLFGASRPGGTHDGVDYSAADGTKIRAAHGGTVIYNGEAPSGWREYIGYAIVTKSTDGYNVIYQEFGGTPGKGGKSYVHKGDKIKTGQVIAKLGHLDGSGSGDHVHVGVSKRSVFKAHSGLSTKGWYDLEKLIKDDK